MTPKIRRGERTTHEQLQYFIAFCKLHPELHLGKHGIHAPQATENLWEQLAQNLNAMRGPTRTATRWRESLIHWRNVVRSRVRKSKSTNNGNGEHPMIQLSVFEEYALKTFDAGTSNNNANDVYLEIEELQPDDEAEFKIETQDELITTPDIQAQRTPSPDVLSEASRPHSPEDSDPLFSMISPSVSPSPPPTDTHETTRSRKRKREQMERLLELAYENLKAQKRREIAEQRREAAEQRREAAEQRREAAEQRREAQEREQSQMLLASNLTLQKAMERMANSFSVLAKALAKNVDK